VILGDMSEAQTAAWIGLLEVSERLPAKSWCLVGGQMVFLYCRERGFVRSRPTDDGEWCSTFGPSRRFCTTLRLPSWTSASKVSA